MNKNRRKEHMPTGHLFIPLIFCSITAYVTICTAIKSMHDPRRFSPPFRTAELLVKVALPSINISDTLA